jgi:hypothetical protein
MQVTHSPVPVPGAVRNGACGGPVSPAFPASWASAPGTRLASRLAAPTARRVKECGFPLLSRLAGPAYDHGRAGEPGGNGSRALSMLWLAMLPPSLRLVSRRTVLSGTVSPGRRNLELPFVVTWGG